MPSYPDFTCALITGAGGGIGKALAQYFISLHKKVLLLGRTESNLADTASQIGAAGYYVLDVGQTASVASFASRITKEHPDLDCLVNNAGIQRPLEVLQGDAADFLAKADQEIDVNIRGPLHLTLALLPHLQTRPCGLVVNVSSVLGFVPFSVVTPVYNGTKAWLHFWSLNLRSQLRQEGSRVKVVEIAPPLVGTDLHRDREDPDDNKKEKNKQALSVEEFMDDVRRGFEAGEDMITAGMGKAIVEKWYSTLGDVYERASSK
ncbi:putative secondary metabolism biosynthetic enzyme [Claviceps sorghi]|nr:putative secondary metabolism biosynthetic enzyme [Claviceps sorghi]